MARPFRDGRFRMDIWTQRLEKVPRALVRLTPNQAMFFCLLAGWISQFGVPTSTELADACQISRSGAGNRVDQLIQKGLMARPAPGSRALSLTEKGRKVLDALTPHVTLQEIS